MNDTHQEPRVTRRPLDDRERMTVPARLFGVSFTTRVEPFVVGIARTLSADYTGGYWEFYALSNGGFYMAPAGGERYGSAARTASTARCRPTRSASRAACTRTATCRSPGQTRWRGSARGSTTCCGSGC